MWGFPTIQTMSISSRWFGKSRNGEDVYEYTVKNRKGFGFSVIGYGADLTEIRVPDKNGNNLDVCLGFSSLERYEGEQSGCAGAVIGRVGSRISNACFDLDGETYNLTANNGPNTLHSGDRGFDRRVWNGYEIDDCSVGFELVSEDGDQGFPGTLQVNVEYSFSEHNELRIIYYAKTDKPTLCDITNHCYFNLNGHSSSTILDHDLQVFADRILDVGTDLIPTGYFIHTTDIPFGFVMPTSIRKAIEQSQKYQGIAFHRGIDTNYCLNEDGKIKHAARLSSLSSGIVMDVMTDQPSIHVYTGMCLDFSGKNGSYYQPYSGIALLTEHYPDAIHQPGFPSYILRPGEQYRTETTYAFSLM